jgi:hypothetical protein
MAAMAAMTAITRDVGDFSTGLRSTTMPESFLTL